MNVYTIYAFTPQQMPKNVLRIATNIGLSTYVKNNKFRRTSTALGVKP
jgi:hypothetical protein